jgi:hypothetical protein
MELKTKLVYYKNGFKKINTDTQNGERERNRKLERSLEQTPEEDKTREREMKRPTRERGEEDKGNW